MRKFFIPLLTVAAVVAIVLSGCVPEAAPPVEEEGPPVEEEGPPVEEEGPPEFEVTEWNLPILIPLTGGFAGFGIEGKWAIETAVEDINAAGGIAGKPLKVTFYDSGSDPTQAHAQMGRILDTKPLMVVVDDGEPQGRAVGASIVSEQVFAIIPATGTMCNMEFRPWTVSFVNYDENICGLGGPAWIEREPDIKTVVPIYDDTVEWYMGCARCQIQALEEAGVTITAPVTFEQFVTVDFGPVAVAALEKNADGYLFVSIGDPVAKTIIELHRRGMTDNRRILIAGSADYPELYEVGEGYIDDCYMFAWLNTDYPGERWQSVKNRYAEVSELPAGFGTYISYDIPYYFKYCVETAGVTGNPAMLAKERLMLANVGYNVEAFEFTMGTYPVIDGVAMGPIFLSQIKDNRKVLVETIPGEVIPEQWRGGPQPPKP